MSVIDNLVQVGRMDAEELQAAIDVLRPLVEADPTLDRSTSLTDIEILELVLTVIRQLRETQDQVAELGERLRAGRAPARPLSLVQKQCLAAASKTPGIVRGRSDTPNPLPHIGWRMVFQTATVDSLWGQGYLCHDAADPAIYRLTATGYNALPAGGWRDGATPPRERNLRS